MYGETETPKNMAGEYDKQWQGRIFFRVVYLTLWEKDSLKLVAYHTDAFRLCRAL